MFRERVLINTEKDKVIVTVKKDGRNNSKHIFITVPFHMKWATILKTLKNLPKHLENERRKKKKSKK